MSVRPQRPLVAGIALCAAVVLTACTGSTAPTTAPPRSTAPSSSTTTTAAVAESPPSTPAPAPPSTAACAPASILFVRGGPGSGGFLEGGADSHLSDISDLSTAERNTGWGTLAGLLEADGFVLEQRIEAVEPILEDLDRYAVVVFGSNNADYGESDAEAVEAYIRAGGGALFISDANWGSDWDKAPTSDQTFLDRFDIVVNQDHGTYERTRDRHFAEPDHPIFAGVDSFDGEGVSPFTIVDRVADVDPRALASAGESIRRNLPGQGPVEPSVEADAAVVAAEVGAGRVLGHFDRNTFFNRNGAGTSIERLDNARYAVNVFRWLSQTETRPPCS